MICIYIYIFLCLMVFDGLLVIFCWFCGFLVIMMMIDGKKGTGEVWENVKNKWRIWWIWVHGSHLPTFNLLVYWDISILGAQLFVRSQACIPERCFGVRRYRDLTQNNLHIIYIYIPVDFLLPKSSLFWLPVHPFKLLVIKLLLSEGKKHRTWTLPIPPKNEVKILVQVHYVIKHPFVGGGSRYHFSPLGCLNGLV